MKNIRLVKNLFIALALSATLGFMACETTEQIDDFPIIKPQIVLNCLISPDSNWVFQVSKSLSVLDNAQTSTLPDAIINVFENGNKLFSPKDLDENDFLFYSQSKPAVGKNYRLSVGVKNFTTVNANCTVPQRVKIEKLSSSIQDSVTYYDPFLKKAYGELKGDLTVSFTDPAGDDNYYFISVFSIDTYSYVQPPYDTVYEIYYNYVVVNNDANPVVEINSDEYSIFSDALIDGQKFDFLLKFKDWSYYTNKYYRVALYSVDKNMYLYYRSKALFDQRQGNPFAEPVQVYSNVENGFGVFGAYVVDVKVMKF